jgi:hypothetical protein
MTAPPMPIDRERWAIRLLVVVLVIAVAYLVVAMFDADAHYRADRVNRSSVQTFDLPVDVTRTIRGDEVEFRLAPRGDEIGVFWIDGDRVNQSPSVNVTASARYMWWIWPFDGAWPTVELKVVRADCTEEVYLLPTRGGAIRGCRGEVVA